MDTLSVSILWLIAGAVVLFGVGLLIGTRLGRTRQGDARQEAEELKVTLRQNEEELRQYRAHVTDHFSQTADLVRTLTADYRAVYEHMAAGAQTLCNGQVKTLTPESLREYLLPAPNGERAQPETAVPQTAALLPEEQLALAEESHELHRELAPAPVLPEENRELQPDLASTPVHSEMEDTETKEAPPRYPREDMRHEP
jgi:uncharacterized membrane-anchored protein YhcB (DUF1043 family)